MTKYAWLLSGYCWRDPLHVRVDAQDADPPGGPRRLKSTSASLTRLSAFRRKANSRI